MAKREKLHVTPEYSAKENVHNKSTNHSPRTQFQCDMDTDSVIIAGVPQEPARAPYSVPSNVYNQFDKCGNKQNRPSSNQHMATHSRKSSQSSVGTHYSQQSPRAREPPIPRQRTPDSLSIACSSDSSSLQKPRSPRRQRPDAETTYYLNNRCELHPDRSFDSQNVRRSNGRNEIMAQRSASDNGYYTDHKSPRRQASPRVRDESHYKAPRRLKTNEDGGSSDSGVQHMASSSHFA